MYDFSAKMTYVNAINYAIRFMQGEDMTEDQKLAVADKLVTLGEQLQKRNASHSNKPTKKQVENGTTKTAIADLLRDATEPMKCGDIANAIGISGQKASALLKQMVDAGEVVKTEEKRVSLFALADTDDPVQALPGEISF